MPKNARVSKYQECGGVRRECCYHERLHNAAQHITAQYTDALFHYSRLEKLAVSSPLSADVDQNHVGIIRHVLFPVRRREGHNIGGKQIVVGSGNTALNREEGHHRQRRCELLPPKAFAFAGAADADPAATEEESHSFSLLFLSPQLKRSYGIHLCVVLRECVVYWYNNIEYGRAGFVLLRRAEAGSVTFSVSREDPRRKDY